jgi:hypothetical protein
MIIKKFPGKFNNENIVIPRYYSEVSYLNELLKILNNQLNDDFELYVIYRDFNVDINTNSNKIRIGIHISNETTFDDKYYDKLDIIFRYYLSEQCDYNKVFPINIGYNSSGYESLKFNPNKKITDREIDLFFYGQINNRQELYESSKKISGNNELNFTSGFREGINIIEYTNLLSNSKISLVPKGVSPETFRFSESFASGCVVITTEKINVWYYENCPAIFLNSWLELNQNLIDEILNFDDIDSLRIKSIDYYEKYLSAKANANYILNKIKSKFS